MGRGHRYLTPRGFRLIARTDTRGDDMLSAQIRSISVIRGVCALSEVPFRKHKPRMKPIDAFARIPLLVPWLRVCFCLPLATMPRPRKRIKRLKSVTAQSSTRSTQQSLLGLIT